VSAEIIRLADHRTLRTRAYRPAAQPAPIPPIPLEAFALAGLAWLAAVVIFAAQRSRA